MLSVPSYHSSASFDILHVCYRCPLITHQLLPIYYMYVIGALLSLISFFRYTKCMLSVPSYHWSASSDILHVCYRCPPVTDQHLPIYYMYGIGVLLSLISIFQYTSCMVLVSSCHWSASSNILHVCYRCPPVTDQHLPIYFMYVIDALLSLISIFQYTSCMLSMPSCHWSASSDILHVLLSMPSCHWSASSNILHVCYRCPLVTDQHLPIYFMYVIYALLSLISIFRYTTCIIIDALLSLICIFRYTACMVLVSSCHWSVSSKILHLYYRCPLITDQHLPIYYMYIIGALLSLISIFRYITCMVLVSSCHWSASSDILHVCYRCPLVTDQHLPIYYMYYYRCPPVTDLHLPIYCMYGIGVLLSLISIFQYTTCMLSVPSCHWSASSDILHVCYRCPLITDQHLPIYYMYGIDALLSLISIFQYTSCMLSVPSYHSSASSDILHVCYWCPLITHQLLPIYYMYVIGALLSLISIFRYTTCMLSVPFCHWSASSDILHVCYRCPLITDLHLPIYCMYGIGVLLSLISIFQYTSCILSVPSYHWSASSDILHVWYWYPPVTDQHLPIYYMYGIVVLLSLISIFRYTACMVLVSSCHWSASSNILHVCYRCPLITDQHLPIYYMYGIGVLLSLISIFLYTTCMVLVSSCHWSASSDILHVWYWYPPVTDQHVWYWYPPVTDQHLPIYYMYVISALLSLISIFRYTTCIIIDALLSLICIFRYTACMVLVSSCHWSASSDILHVCYRCRPITDQHLPMYYMYVIGALLSLISIFRYTTCMLSVPSYHSSASSNIPHVCYRCPLSLISIFRYTTCMVLVSSCHWSASSDVLHVWYWYPPVLDQHLPIYHMYVIGAPYHWSASSDKPHVCYRCPLITDQHLPIYYMYVIGVLLSLISIFRYTICMLSVPSYHWSASSDILHVWYRCPPVTDQHLPIYFMYVIDALLSLISIFRYTTCMVLVSSCHWSASSNILHVWYWCPPVTDQHLPIYFMYVIGALLSLISIFQYTSCMLSMPSCHWSASSNILHVCYRCPLVTDQHLPIYYMYGIGILLSLICIFRYTACMVLVSSCHWSVFPKYYIYIIGALLSLISIFQYTTCILSVPSYHWSASSDI